MPDPTTSGARFGGYTLVEKRPAPEGQAERWLARGPRGPAEVAIGGASLLKAGRGLPGWGPFPSLDWGEQEGHAWVAVPGRLVEDLAALGRRLEPGAALAFGWHLVAAVAELHENGAAHGALSASHAGLDEYGRLAIRPALTGGAVSEPDPAASAQATDCLALGLMLEQLRVELIDDDAVRLLMRGLRRERARLRLHPGRSVRQAMAAVLARHPGFEGQLVDVLGPAWLLSRLPTAPPPVRPRARPSASWERSQEDDQDAVSAPAQVFLGQGRSSDTPDPQAAVRPAPPAGAFVPDPVDDDDLVPEGSELREEDTALQPVPESAAADIVEPEDLPEDLQEDLPEDDDGDPITHLEAGEAPEDELRSMDMHGLDAGLVTALGRESTTDPLTDGTVDTSSAERATEGTEDPSSVLHGLASVRYGRDEIPLGALEIVGPEPVDDDHSDSWHSESWQVSEAERQALAALEAAEREAAEREAAEREAAEREAAEREAAEREAAELEAAELEAAEREAAERVAAQREAAEREAEERAAAEREAAEREAAEREAAEREAAEREAAELEAAELEAAELAAEEAAAAERATALEAEALAAREAAERQAAERRAAERQAAERQAAERRAAARLAEEQATHELAAREADDDRDDDRDDEPKWAGLRGVTGDSSREAELGQGKWTEPARSLDEVARELPSGPARAMDLESEDERGPALYIALGFAALLILAFLGWKVANGEPTEETQVEAPTPTETTAVAEALPEGPTVTVVSEPAGGRISLDGADLGRAPAVVPVPTDPEEHELCIELSGQRTCRQLTGPALASSDPYVFKID